MVFCVLVVMDGIMLINTPSSGAETSHLLTVRLLKVSLSPDSLLLCVFIVAMWLSVDCNLQSGLLFCVGVLLEYIVCEICVIKLTAAVIVECRCYCIVLL